LKDDKGSFRVHDNEEGCFASKGFDGNFSCGALRQWSVSTASDKTDSAVMTQTMRMANSFYWMPLPVLL
jgi:hypothetical protein